MNVEAVSPANAANELNRSCPTSESLPKKHPLPIGFVPGDNDVIIGRGKKCYNHVGNLALRKIVGSKIDIYLKAKNKVEKSDIISSIVAQIRSKGHFAKEDCNKPGHWFEVGDAAARDKIAQAFRDALHDNYRSSTHFKKKRRQERRKLGLKHCSQAWEISSIAKLVYNQRLQSSPTVPPQARLAMLKFQSSFESINLVDALSSSLPAQCFEDENPFEPIPISTAFNTQNSNGGIEPWLNGVTHSSSILVNLNQTTGNENECKSISPFINMNTAVTAK